MRTRRVHPTARLRSRTGAALLILIVTPAAAAAADLSEAVLAELNFARIHPSQYARTLQQDARSDDPDADDAGFTSDDPRALREAIDFLERQRPLPPLRRDPRLAAAASDYVEAQGPGGGAGHDDVAGGSFESRLHHYGLWAGLSGENISYGYWTPREVVRQLIVDSGVQGRGHRKSIFDTAYQYAGVACGRHRTYRYMCVIDFAGMIVSR